MAPQCLQQQDMRRHSMTAAQTTEMVGDQTPMPTKEYAGSLLSKHFLSVPRVRQCRAR